MYMDDRMKSGKTSMLRSDLLHEVVFTPGLRPSVPAELVERFVLKMKRLTPGYSPETSGELLDWVKERVLIPASEWAQLLSTTPLPCGGKTGHDSSTECRGTSCCCAGTFPADHGRCLWGGRRSEGGNPLHGEKCVRRPGAERIGCGGRSG